MPHATQDQFDVFVEASLQATWAANAEPLRLRVLAGEFGNTTAFLADTFARSDCLPTHDGQQIVWTGCTEHSNVWDRALATSYRREDGSWGLRDFVIQFCSEPEGCPGAPIGT